MTQYTLKRIGLFFPTLLLMTMLVFVVMRIIPGDPAIALLEGDGGGSYTLQDLENLREENWAPIGTWLSNMSVGSAG